MKETRREFGRKKKHHSEHDCDSEVRSINFRSVCISRQYQLDFSNVRGIEDCVPQCPNELCFKC